MASNMTLAEAIRSIRKGRSMTTSELARQIGVAQSVVSRYEAGLRSPSWRTLAKLLLLADGAEKSRIIEALSAVRGRPVSEVEATRESKLVTEEDEFLKRVSDYPDLLNRGRFGSLARAIMMQQEWEVAESLNAILSLWLESDHSAEASRCFQDAATFLKIALSSGPPRRASESPPEMAGKTKYRVIAPVDLADGSRYTPGDVVELDLATATTHSHALIRIESQAPHSQRKKLA
jgi:transcriptional regulator with XRE-family HTH domain